MNSKTDPYAPIEVDGVVMEKVVYPNQGRMTVDYSLNVFRTIPALSRREVMITALKRELEGEEVTHKAYIQAAVGKLGSYVRTRFKQLAPGWSYHVQTRLYKRQRVNDEWLTQPLIEISASKTYPERCSVTWTYFVPDDVDKDKLNRWVKARAAWLKTYEVK